MRAEVRAAIAESGLDAEGWLERELRNLQRKRKPNHREIETLRMLRDALARAELRV